MANQALLIVALGLLAASISCAGPTLGSSGSTKDAIPQMKPSEYAKMMAKTPGARPITSVLAEEAASPPWSYNDPTKWKTDYSEDTKERALLKEADKDGLLASGKATFPPTMGMCDGWHQSPIDIIKAKTEEGVENRLSFDWFNATGFNWKSGNPGLLYLEGTGFDGSTTTFDGFTYKLKRARFVSPSEHSIDGQQHPFEIQFEHHSVKRPDGVFGPMHIAVHFDWSDDRDLIIDDLGEEEADARDLKTSKPGNPIFEKDLDWFDTMKEIRSDAPGTKEIPGRCCQQCPFAKKEEDQKPEVIGCKFFQPMELLPPPGRQDYFWYYGSQTTPPCEENVLWLVMKKPMFFTYDQWKAFSFQGNFRPVQLGTHSKVHYLNGKPEPPAAPGLDKHAFVEDCGPWHLNCAKDEFYSTR